MVESKEKTKENCFHAPESLTCVLNSLEKKVELKSPPIQDFINPSPRVRFAQARSFSALFEKPKCPSNVVLYYYLFDDSCFVLFRKQLL